MCVENEKTRGPAWCAQGAARDCAMACHVVALGRATLCVESALELLIADGARC